MIRKSTTALLASLLLAGLGLVLPSPAWASQYKYHVFYQSRYSGEVRESRLVYDTYEDAKTVAANLRTVHAVSNVWIETKEVDPTPSRAPQYGVGDSVQVKWRGKWWDAEVLDVNGDSYYITYPGWNSSWNEWVGPDRIRP